VCFYACNVIPTWLVFSSRQFNEIKEFKEFKENEEAVTSAQTVYLSFRLKRGIGQPNAQYRPGCSRLFGFGCAVM
jgi:hypothetical protein